MTRRKEKAFRKPAADRKLRFAEEYLVDLDATAAAIRTGYSAKTAKQQGHRLLTDASVTGHVTRLQAARREVTGDLAARVLAELQIIAFADIGDILTVDGDGRVLVRDLTTLTPEVRRTLAEITQVTTEKTTNRRRVGYGAEGSGDDGGDYQKTEVEKVRLSIKQHAKLTALQMLVNHLGLNAPIKHDVSVDVQSAKESLGSKLDELRSRVGTPSISS